MKRLMALAALGFAAGCVYSPPIERWSGPPISSDQYESHPAFDPRTRDLYFVRGAPNFSNWRLMMSACGPHRQRRAPIPPSFAAPDAVEADPWFTPEGDTLYFISARPENGVAQRELDIWAVSRGADNVWRQPEHLPQPVNSPAQEWFPRLGPDGWLYCGSNRRGGLGQTDIYRAHADGVGGWRVENLGPNINSPGDEYEAELSPDGRRMILMADGDLYESDYRDGEWTPRVKLPRDVNTEVMEVGALLSPDGHSIMFARDTGNPALSGEIYWRRNAGSWPPRCR
jgi:hypothetical protein